MTTRQLTDGSPVPEDDSHTELRADGQRRLVTERPILFSAPMVRAILEGRKIQTRRVIQRTIEGSPYKASWVLLPGCVNKRTPPCPYGLPGDALWVRETWLTESYAYNDLKPSDLSGEETILYAADADWSANKTVGRKRVSLHMPRWASRLTLRITSTRLERLQDITESDCIAEGCGSPITRDCKKPKFMALWESINGPGSWEENPYVWAITFRVATRRRHSPAAQYAWAASQPSRNHRM
jgi:hypothetical protein